MNEKSFWIDPNKEELIAGLTELDGRPVSEEILSRILTEPDITRVIFIGPPMDGKTTKIGQLVEAIKRNAKLHQIPLSLSLEFYDNLLRDTPGSIWDTAKFNDLFVDRIHNPSNWFELYSEPGKIPKKLQIIEVPAKGRIRQKDRGVSAVNRILTESEDCLCIDGIPHPLAIERGILTRQIIKTTPSTILIDNLESFAKLIVHKDGIEDKLTLAEILKTRNELEATAEQTSTILDEMIEEALIWRRSRQNRMLAEELIRQHSILPDAYTNPYDLAFQKFSESGWTDFLPNLLMRLVKRWRPEFTPLLVAHSLANFQSLNLPRDRYYVVFTPCKLDYIHLNLT